MKPIAWNRARDIFFWVATVLCLAGFAFSVWLLSKPVTYAGSSIGFSTLSGDKITVNGQGMLLEAASPDPFTIDGPAGQIIFSVPSEKPFPSYSKIPYHYVKAFEIKQGVWVMNNSSVNVHIKNTNINTGVKVARSVTTIFVNVLGVGFVTALVWVFLALSIEQTVKNLDKKQLLKLGASTTTQ